jgi:hypothetical protein
MRGERGERGALVGEYALRTYSPLSPLIERHQLTSLRHAFALIKACTSTKVHILTHLLVPKRTYSPLSPLIER